MESEDPKLPAVRSIAWLGLTADSAEIFNDREGEEHILLRVVDRRLKVWCVGSAVSNVAQLLNSRQDRRGNCIMTPKNVEEPH